MAITLPLLRPGLRTWFVCCALLAGTVLLYRRAESYGFANYDDPRYLTNNAHVQAGLTRESIAWAFTGHADYWHPLTWLSHMLDWEIHGANASGHRFTSTLWHALNALLAFLVLRRLTGAYWTSAFSAALFAWHPLRVESVVWIAERKDVMSGCFFLLTLWAYAAYASRRRAHRRAWPVYLLTLAAFLAGLMSKPVLVALPLVLLALDFWPLSRLPLARTSGREFWTLARPLLLEKIPFLLLSAVVAALTIVMQRHDGAFVLELPFGARAGNALVSLPRYLGKFFWPVNLTPFYPHPGAWTLPVIAAAALLALALVALAWRQRVARPWLIVGIAWFLALLLPVLGFVQVGFQALADRYLYLPTLGLQLALLWTLRDLGRGRRMVRHATAGALALLGACALRTWDQQATWRDPVALLEHALAVTTRNATAHGFFAYTLSGFGRVAEAERHAQLALALDPQQDIAHLTLAEIRTQQGRFAEAVAARREALRLNPHDNANTYELGLLLFSQGDADAARPLLHAAFQRQPDLVATNLQTAFGELQRGRAAAALARCQLVLAVEPEHADAHFGCGHALARLDRFEEALTHFETAARLQPSHAGAHLEAGFLLLQRQRFAPALEHFRAAISAEPESALAHVGLGRAAEQLGQPALANSSFERALALAPAHPHVRRAWAETLARRGEFTAAADHYRQLVELQPDDAEAHAALGFVLFLGGRREEGVAQWEEALRLNPNFPGLRERIERTRR